jgi:hypothetical protein
MLPTDPPVKRRRTDSPWHRVRVIGSVLAACLTLVGALYSIQREGQIALRDSARAGCERAKLDRAANAHGWRNAEDARRAAGEIRVANIYADIARELEQRSRVDCSEAFQ